LSGVRRNAAAAASEVDAAGESETTVAEDESMVFF
jgi:hypothetical protein